MPNATHEDATEGRDGRVMAKLNEILDKLTTLVERVETLASESTDPARQVPGPVPDPGTFPPGRSAGTPKPAK